MQWVGELVGATLADIRRDEHGDHWLHVLGKGGKRGKVALPPLARTALDQYLVPRGQPVTPARWNPATPLVANLEEDGAGIESSRLWRVLRRFFVLVADAIQDARPTTAEKLSRARPHWMRHTHASHALARGAELIMVRDNLCHSSISTTSTHLHGDEVQRARQFDQAFAAWDFKPSFSRRRQQQSSMILIDCALQSASSRIEFNRTLLWRARRSR